MSAKPWTKCVAWTIGMISVCALAGACVTGFFANDAGSGVADAGTTGARPLVGRWVTKINQGIIQETMTFELDRDSTFILTGVGSGPCSGTITYAGGTWTSTAQTVTLAGTPTCSGGFSCKLGAEERSYTCANRPFYSDVFDYRLSSDQNSLTLSQIGDAGICQYQNDGGISCAAPVFRRK
jgi:hypothetical protein